MKRLLPCALALMLLACVPTPDEEAVINRADGALEKAVLSSPVDPYTYEAPTRWEETVMLREQEVRIAADIVVPNANQFPVVTIRQREFTSGDVDAFLQAVCPGDWTVRENAYSREELTVDLQKAAKGEYLGEDEETGEPIWKPMEEEMKRIQGLIEQAPIEDTFVPITGDLKADAAHPACLRDSAQTTWYYRKLGKGLLLERYRDGNIQQENWVLQGDAYPGEKPHALENIRITEAEAIAKADAVVAALGLSDFRAADSQRARAIQTYFFADYGEGYLLTYVQSLPGAAPCYYTQYSDPDFISWTLQQTGAATFAPPWYQEHLQLFVTDAGVQSISWFQPKETVLTANENVQLMPFSDIQKNVLKLIEFCTGGAKNTPILVNRIVLTAAIAKIPDQGDEAFLVPTWAFFMTNEHNERFHIDEQVLLINAIDGTYIYRSKNDDGLPETESPNGARE